MLAVEATAGFRLAEAQTTAVERCLRRYEERWPAHRLACREVVSRASFSGEGRGHPMMQRWLTALQVWAAGTQCWWGVLWVFLWLVQREMKTRGLRFPFWV